MEPLGHLGMASFRLVRGWAVTRGSSTLLDDINILASVVVVAKVFEVDLFFNLSWQPVAEMCIIWVIVASSPQVRIWMGTANVRRRNSTAVARNASLRLA